MEIGKDITFEELCSEQTAEHRHVLEFIDALTLKELKQLYGSVINLSGWQSHYEYIADLIETKTRSES